MELKHRRRPHEDDSVRSEALNRTKMELKLRIRLQPEPSGIPGEALNRTKMELKLCQHVLQAFLEREALNRTRMELKRRQFRTAARHFREALYRTRMELKLTVATATLTACAVRLLIEPGWN